MANEPPESSPPAQKKLEKLEEASKSLGQMQHMSEMAWAMVLVSSLNEALKGLLEDSFVDNEKAAERMLGDRGLSEFWAIELAFLLGLISAREQKQLHLLRKIRNAFAHKVNLLSLSQVSFSQSPIKEWCLQLDETKGMRLGGMHSLSEPAERFMNSCAFLWFVLIYRREQIEHREEAQSITEDDIYPRISKMSDPAK